jgi:hypothetical protein
MATRRRSSDTDKREAKRAGAKRGAARGATNGRTARAVPTGSAGKTLARRPADGARAAKLPRLQADLRAFDPALFDPLTEGERADAIRLVTEEKQLAAMAKVGRYRVVAAEPLVVKPPLPRSGRRLARVVIYDYAADRCVDATVDLDAGEVFHAASSHTQPMLAEEEEGDAVAIAVGDAAVKARLSLGDEPQAAMHYWSRHMSDLAFHRRSVAVLFGQPGCAPSVIAVVDLIDRVVAEIVPGDQW